MKLLALFISLFGLTNVIDLNSEIKPAIQHDCNQVLDSAAILIQTGPFTINEQITIKDETRLNEISKWFEQRSYSELTCLLESENKLYELYAYILSVKFHEDSLEDKYNYLLSDTTPIQFSGRKKVNQKLTIGNVIKTMTEKIGNENRDFKRRPEIESKVSSFIRQYAQYPDTYKPLSFPEFAMGSDNNGLSDYNIRHEYEIKNIHGKIVKIISAFVLDPELNINVIEQDSSKYISSSQPILEEWFKEYGRKLNRSDSINLRYR